MGQGKSTRVVSVWPSRSATTASHSRDMARAELVPTAGHDDLRVNRPLQLPALDDAFVGCTVNNPEPDAECSRDRNYKHRKKKKKKRSVRFAAQDLHRYIISESTATTASLRLDAKKSKSNKSTRRPVLRVLTKMERRHRQPSSSAARPRQDTHTRHAKSRPPSEASAGARARHLDRGRDPYNQYPVDEFEGRDQQRRPRRGSRSDITHLSDARRSETLRGSANGKHAEGSSRIPVRAGSSRAAVVSPSVSSGSSGDSSDGSGLNEPVRRNVGSQKWRSRGDQYVSRHIDHAMLQEPSEESDTSSVESEQFIHPASAAKKQPARYRDGRPAASRHRSRRGSNQSMQPPPQIYDFQRSIEEVYREGGALVDPDTLPSPRSATPEGRSHSSRKPDMRSNVGRSRVAPPAPSPPLAPSPPPIPSPPRASSLPQQSRQYYSPERVGNDRPGRGWDPRSLDPTDQDDEPDSDDSFLDYEDVDEPEAENPNGIRLLPTSAGHYYPNNVDLPSPISENESEEEEMRAHQTVPEMKERSLLQNEWRRISLNLRHAQHPKQSSRVSSRPADQQQPQLVKKASKSRTRPKEHSRHTGHPRSLPEKQERHGGGDAFTTIPTTTRTMVAPGALTVTKGHAQKHLDQAHRPPRSTASEMKENSQAKPQTISIQFGSRPPMRMSLGKSSTVSVTSSKGGSKSDNPGVKNRAHPGRTRPESPQDTHGFTHTPGAEMWPADHHATSVRDGHKRSPSQAAEPRRRRASTSSKIDIYVPRKPRRQSTASESHSHVESRPMVPVEAPSDDEVIDILDELSEQSVDTSDEEIPLPPPPPFVPEPPAVPRETKPQADSRSGINGADLSAFPRTFNNFPFPPEQMQWPLHRGMANTPGSEMMTPQGNGMLSRLGNGPPSQLANGIPNLQGYEMPNQQIRGIPVEHIEAPPMQRVSRMPMQQDNGPPPHQFNGMPIQHVAAPPMQRVNRMPIQQGNGMLIRRGSGIPSQHGSELLTLQGNEVPTQPANGSTNQEGSEPTTKEANGATGAQDTTVAPKGPAITERFRELFQRTFAAVPAKNSADSPKTAANTSEPVKAPGPMDIIPTLVPTSISKAANTSKPIKSSSKTPIATDKEVKPTNEPNNPPKPWPKLSRREIVLFISRFWQYIVYFLAFGFAMMILGRVASFIVIVGSWIAWFAWPFVWVFGTVGRLLVKV